MGISLLTPCAIPKENGMKLQEICLHLQTYLPPVRTRLQDIIERYAPLLTPAFEQDRFAQLLTLFAIDRIERNQLKKAEKLIDRLEPHCKTDAEKALWHVLVGLYCWANDNPDTMAIHFDDAAALGHDHHYPHMLSGEYHLLCTHYFDRALAEFDQAIDCIYKFPPLDEPGRHVIAQAQAAMAYALTMMHRTDEAAAMLAKAEPANDSEEYLHAGAMLSAVNKDADAANQAVSKLTKLHPALGDEVAKHVRLILDGTHIHFFPREVPPGLPADFWAWFREQEPVFQPLLEKNDVDACGHMLAEHINALVPDPEDMMTATIELKDGKPEIVLTACYSRSYAAMIDAIAAACPADIRERWIITLQP